MICHLDYTDETHPNSISGFLLRAVPYVVTGPYRHSSPLNCRFFRGITAPQTLHNAVPYNEPGRTFDAILRWFCADTNIESLPPGHPISLPAPECYQPDLANLIGRSLDSIASITCTVDGVRVTTHCMYPSNGLVQVTVRRC